MMLIFRVIKAYQIINIKYYYNNNVQNLMLHFNNIYNIHYNLQIKKSKECLI